MKITLADGRAVDHRKLRNSIRRVIKASVRMEMRLKPTDEGYAEDIRHYRGGRKLMMRQLRGMANHPGRYARGNA